MDDATLRKLGRRLEGTRNNVFRLCASEFGEEADDETIRGLERVCGLKRCLACDVWDRFAGRVCVECKEG